jgi:hypothetical protein
LNTLMDKVYKVNEFISHTPSSEPHRMFVQYICIVLCRIGTLDVLVFKIYNNKQSTKAITMVYVEPKCIQEHCSCTTAVIFPSSLPLLLLQNKSPVKRDGRTQSA